MSVTLNDKQNNGFPTPQGVGQGDFMSSDDMNKYLSLLAERTAYLFTLGICPWDAKYAYPSGAMAQVAGVIFQSKTNNIDKPPAQSPNDWEVCIIKRGDSDARYLLKTGDDTNNTLAMGTLIAKSTQIIKSRNTAMDWHIHAADDDLRIFNTTNQQLSLRLFKGGELWTPAYGWLHDRFAEKGNTYVKNETYTRQEIHDRFIQQDAKGVNDWNSIRKNGFFWSLPNAVTNSPNNAMHWQGIVSQHNDSWVTQEVWGFTGDSATDTVCYRRDSSDNNGAMVWGGWYKVLKSEVEILKRITEYGYSRADVDAKVSNAVNGSNNLAADRYTKAESDSRFVNTTGDTMTGVLRHKSGTGPNAGSKGDTDQDTGREWLNDGEMRDIVNNAPAHYMSNNVHQFWAGDKRFEFQNNGNIAIYDASGAVMWHRMDVYQRAESNERFFLKGGDTASGNISLSCNWGGWAGFQANNTDANGHVFFNGATGNVAKGGMEILCDGNGKHFVRMTATPIGATNTDRRTAVLDLHDSAVVAHKQLRVPQGTLEQGGGIRAANADFDTGIEFPWADSGFRFRRDGQVPLEFAQDGTTRFTHNGGSGRFEMHSNGNTAWYDAAGSIKAAVWSDGSIHSEKQIYAKTNIAAEGEVKGANLRALQTLIINGRSDISREHHIYSAEGFDLRIHSSTRGGQVFQLNSDGNIHTPAYGWLHERFAPNHRVGDIGMTHAHTPPVNSIFWTNSALSRTAYAALFALYGASYGGDGSTTFCLPPLSDGDVLWAAVSASQSRAVSAGENLAHSHAASTDNQGDHQHLFENSVRIGDSDRGSLPSLWSIDGSAVQGTSISGAHVHQINVAPSGGSKNKAAGLGARVYVYYQ